MTRQHNVGARAHTVDRAVLHAALNTAHLSAPSPELRATRDDLAAARDRAAEHARAAAEWLELCPGDTFAAQCVADAAAELAQTNHARTQLCAPDATAADTAVQLHREALAATLRDSEALRGIGYRELILLALAARRDAAELPAHLAVPILRLALVRAAVTQLIIIALLLAAIAGRMREYTPPARSAIPATPEQLTRTLALAPGAPSLTVCA